MCKEIVVHTYHGILFRNKKNELVLHTVSWMNLQEITLIHKSYQQNCANPEIQTEIQGP